jgi:hypothetical protein
MEFYYRNVYTHANTKQRNKKTGTKPPEEPERSEQESEMTGTAETKIEHDRNKVVEHDRNNSYLGLIQTVHLN